MKSSIKQAIKQETHSSNVL